MLNPQNIVLNDINELKVKVVLTLLTISKFANLGQEIQRVWRHCNFNAFPFFLEFNSVVVGVVVAGAPTYVCSNLKISIIERYQNTWQGFIFKYTLP